MAPTREVVNSSSIIILLKLNKNKRRRPYTWCKKRLLKWEKHTHVMLLKELTDYYSDYMKYLRMDEATYYRLFEMVAPLIQKERAE